MCLEKEILTNLKKEDVMKAVIESIELGLFVLIPASIVAVVVISIFWGWWHKKILIWPNLSAYDKSIYKWFIDIQKFKIITNN